MYLAYNIYLNDLIFCSNKPKGTLTYLWTYMVILCNIVNNTELRSTQRNRTTATQPSCATSEPLCLYDHRKAPTSTPRSDRR